MLSQRMLANISFVKKGSIVADIGCDHGLVPIYLIENNISGYVYAMDIRRGPLDRAKENIKLHGLQEHIETRLSSGLAGLEIINGKLEADTVLIAGLGGNITVDIIDDSIDKVRLLESLILQPQSNIDRVRKKIVSIGFHIEDEKYILEDGKYYTVMLVKPGQSAPLSDIQLKYGPVLLDEKNEILKKHLLEKLKKFTDIKEELLKKEKKATDRGLEEINIIIGELEEVLFSCFHV